MAHMCHFSSKPHAKLCCGGEDLPCAMHPITEPGTSWLHHPDMASFRTVVHSSPLLTTRRKIPTDKKASSAPTSVERNFASPRTEKEKPVSEKAAERAAESDISISSIASSKSPAEVYAPKGLITDDSDVDTYTDGSSSPNFFEKYSKAALVACFGGSDETPSHTSSIRKRRSAKLRTKKKVRGIRNPHIHSGFGYATPYSTSYHSQSQSKSHRSRRRGLSTDTSVEGDTTHCSHCHISLTTPSPLPPKNYPEGSPKRPKSLTPPPPNSPNLSSTKQHKSQEEHKHDHRDVPPGKHPETIPEGENSQNNSNSTNGNEGGNKDFCSKTSRNVITTKADIESTVTRRSLSSPSHSIGSSIIITPHHRRKKGPAPLVPTTSASNSPVSFSHSMSSGSISISPNQNRSSYSTNPATDPSLVFHLTRSISEHKKINMKNYINAVPSCRSEVDLQDATRKSLSSFENIDELVLDDNKLISQEAKIIKVNDHVPSKNIRTKTIDQKIIQKNDVSIQVETLHLMQNHSKYSHEIPKLFLPKKTFNPVSMFGCDCNGKSNHFNNVRLRKGSIGKRSYSLSLSDHNKSHVKSNQEGIRSIDLNQFSKDLDALLSPKHEVIKSKTESSLLKRGSDGSITGSATTVVEFLNALTDLGNEMKLTDVQLQTGNDATSDDTSDDRITVMSMPTKWKLSSSSIDSTLSSECTLLPSYNNKEKQGFHSYNNKSNGNHHQDMNTLSSDRSVSSLSTSSTLSAPSTSHSSSSTPTPMKNAEALSFENPNYISPKNTCSKNNSTKIDLNHHIETDENRASGCNHSKNMNSQGKFYLIVEFYKSRTVNVYLLFIFYLIFEF